MAVAMNALKAAAVRAVVEWAAGHAGALLSQVSALRATSPTGSFKSVNARTPQIERQAGRVSAKTLGETVGRRSVGLGEMAAREFAGRAAPSATTPITKIVGNLADDALVHFGPSSYGTIKPNYGKSFWFRYGDIKHLTAKQIEGVIGPAKSGTSGAAKVMHVLTKIPKSAEKVFGGKVGEIPEYILREAATPVRTIVIQGGG